MDDIWHTMDHVVDEEEEAAFNSGDNSLPGPSSFWNVLKFKCILHLQQEQSRTQ